jgi:hypothetical protein
VSPNFDPASRGYEARQQQNHTPRAERVFEDSADRCKTLSRQAQDCCCVVAPVKSLRRQDSTAKAEAVRLARALGPVIVSSGGVGVGIWDQDWDHREG